MIKIKVPELLKKHGMNATDLFRQGNIAYGTAVRLAKGQGTAISFDVLESLCKLFEVKVLAVNILVNKSKNKVFRGVKGRRSGFKKAIVTLEPGKVIEFSKGA